jgi:hypothetical protein
MIDALRQIIAADGAPVERSAFRRGGLRSANGNSGREVGAPIQPAIQSREPDRAEPGEIFVRGTDTACHASVAGEFRAVE